MLYISNSTYNLYTPFPAWPFNQVCSESFMIMMMMMIKKKKKVKITVVVYRLFGSKKNK